LVQVHGTIVVRGRGEAASSIELGVSGGIDLYVCSRVRVHSMHEKSLKMLEFGIKTSRPLKVLENR